MRPHYEQYRKEMLGISAEFQDFIMERMHVIGTILQPYTSVRGQLKGENLLGLEIKNDRRYAETGNLCIEVAEKARPRDGDYVKSGIFRSDNTWLYGIGNQQTFFIFAKSTLRNTHASLRKNGIAGRNGLFRWNGFFEYANETSKGFCIPPAMAGTLYARKISFNFDGSVKQVEVGGQQSEVDLVSIATPPEFQMHLKIA